MAHYMTLLIDGVEMPTRHLDKVFVNEELVWSSNSGRSVTALWVGDITDEKFTISLNFRCLSHSQYKIIKAALPSVDAPYKTVKLVQADGEVVLEMTAYRATVSRDFSAATFANGEVVYNNISFEMIEQ